MADHAIQGQLVSADFEGHITKANQVEVDASRFDGNLATTDNDLQKVAQKLDDLTVPSGGGGDGLSAGEIGTFKVTTDSTPADGYYRRNAANQIIIGTDNESLEDRFARQQYFWIGDRRCKITASVEYANAAQVTFTGYSVPDPAPAELILYWDPQPQVAADVAVDARNFDGNLATTDTDLQRVAQKLDDLDAEDVSVDASGFDGVLETTDNTVQKIAQKLDDLQVGGGSDAPTGGLSRDDVEGFAIKSTSDKVPVARLNPINRSQLEWDARPVQERGYMLGEMIGQYSEAPSADNVGTNQYWRISDSQLEIVDDALTAEQKAKLLLETTVWLNDRGYHVTITNPTGNRFELLLIDPQVSWPAAGVGIDLHWNASAASLELIEDFAEVGAVGTIPATRIADASIEKKKLAQDVIDEINAGAIEFWHTGQTLSVDQVKALHEHIVYFISNRSATVVLPDMSDVDAEINFSIQAHCDVDSVGLTITMTGDGGQTNPTRTAVIINGDFVNIHWTGTTWAYHVTQLSFLLRAGQLDGTKLDFARQNPNASHLEIDLAPIIPKIASDEEAVGGTDNRKYITPRRLNEVLTHHHIETGDRAYFGALEADPTSVTGLDASPIPQAGVQSYTVDTTWGGSRYFYIIQEQGETDVSKITLDGLEDTGWTKGTFTDSGDLWEYWKSPHTWDSATAQEVVIGVERVEPEPEPEPVYYSRKTQADSEFQSFIGDARGEEVSLNYFNRLSATSIRLGTTTQTDVGDITTGTQWWIAWNDLDPVKVVVSSFSDPDFVQRDVTFVGVDFPATISTFRIWRNVGAPHLILAPGADSDYIPWPEDTDELKVTITTSNDWVHSGYLEYKPEQGGLDVWKFVREVGVLPDAESPDTSQAAIVFTTDGDSHTHTFRKETFRTDGKLRLRILNHLSWAPSTAPAAQGHVRVKVEHFVARKQEARIIKPLSTALNINRTTRGNLGTGTSTTVSWSLVRFPESLETKRIESITVYTHRRASPQKTEMQRCTLFPSDIRMLGVNQGDPGNDTEQWKCVLWWGNEDAINPPTFNPSRGFVRDYVSSGPRCLLKLNGEHDYLTGFEITQIVENNSEDQVRLEPEAVEVVYR